MTDEIHFEIRVFEPSDATAVARMRDRSIRQIAPRGYGPAQIDAWAGRTRDVDGFCARMMDGRLALVAVDQASAPLGLIDLEADGHIDMLYSAPEAAGRGVAAALFERVEATALYNSYARLHTEASELARPFFLKQGFEVLERRDFEIDGVPIHNYKMEKRLGD